ncbi:enoyl-CoA hydratase [Pseudomonas graminis]|uniref:enoyl-CoA hydratase n=1 Tax=Pseudomonas graminis TaxID=158627 RepID=UPI003C13E443
MVSQSGFHFSKDERGVALIEIDTQGINILGSQQIDELTKLFETFSADQDARCVLLTSRHPRVFIGGADIKEMADFDPSQARTFISALHRLCEAIRFAPLPVVACIDGWCLGAGVEIAAACDIRIASRSAMFAMPEVRLGIPSVVHAALLPGLIGSGRTRWWLLTGDQINAEKAEFWGLINTVTEPGDLSSAVSQTVDSLVAATVDALRVQKTLLNAWDNALVDDATRLSIGPFGQAFETPEPIEAMTRFLTRKHG